jgi:hypothetical protein
VQLLHKYAWHLHIPYKSHIQTGEIPLFTAGLHGQLSSQEGAGSSLLGLILKCSVISEKMKHFRISYTIIRW